MTDAERKAAIRAAWEQLEATARALLEASRELRIQIAMGRGHLFTASSQEMLATTDALGPLEAAVGRLDEARATTPTGELVHG